MPKNYLFSCQCSRVPNKRACTRYSIFTKLPPCTSYSGVHAYLFFWFFKAFVEKLGLNTDLVLKVSSPIKVQNGRRSKSFIHMVMYMLRVSKVSIIMNETANFHPALFLVFWAKFHPVRVSGLHGCLFLSKLHPARLFWSACLSGTLK